MAQEVRGASSYSGTPDGSFQITVTPNGDIDSPVLGMLHVEGMTRGELSGFIKGINGAESCERSGNDCGILLNVGFSL